MHHPYKKYEDSWLWETIKNSLAEMQKNNDIIVTTSEEYVIGYFCKKPDEEKLLNPDVRFT